MDRDPIQLALSTDIVIDLVLSYLRAGDLLSCRLVSKFWNKAASSVLRKRSTMTKDICYEGDLMELKECMEQSSDFPFVGFNMDEPSQFNTDRATEFFQQYGEQFTSLCLNAHWVMRPLDLAPFIHHLPRLSILDIHPPGTKRSWDLESSPVLLLDSAVADGRVLKLPSVRTIRFLGPCVRAVREELLLEVLTAVSPSVQIDCFDVKPGVVRTLQSAGLLQALSFMRFGTEKDSYRDELRTEMDQLLSNELPSLTELDVNEAGCLSLKGLEKILFFSRHTLKRLHLRGQWLSEYSLWKKFPVLPYLTELGLHARNDFHDNFLFRGRHGDKFPALKELHLCVQYTGNPRPGHSSDLFVVPSVTRLDLEGFVEEDLMEQLAQSFPNVIRMRVDYGFYGGQHKPYRSDPFKIWNVGNFKCLESLRIWNFTVRQPSKDYINMDRFLTGMPVGICENLRKRKPMNLVDSPLSPFNEILRDSPSILQLENLKELIVCVDPEYGLKELPENTPFISMVSVWCLGNDASFASKICLCA